MARKKRHQQPGPCPDDGADVNSRGERKGFHVSDGSVRTTREFRRMAGAPHRTFSVSSRTLVPQTMLPAPSDVEGSPSPSSDVPQTMLSHSEASHVVPHTMLSLSAPSVVEGSLPVSQTMVPAPSAVEGSQPAPSDVEGSPSAGQAVPQATFRPSGVFALPQVTSVRQALAARRSWPPLTRWLPQMTCALHGVVSAWIACPAMAPPSAGGSRLAPVESDCASSTAPRALRKPAPCVNAL